MPQVAVISREGKSVVFVMKNGKAEQREVTTGTEQNGQIEIRSGVKSGESVIRLGQYELEDGAEVKLSAPPKGN